MNKLVLTLVAGLSLPLQAAFAHGPDQAPHQIADLGQFQLEGGGVIDNLRMSYVTHGTLSQAKDNAILVMHGFAANHHLADHLIGPGKARTVRVSGAGRGAGGRGAVGRGGHQRSR